MHLVLTTREYRVHFAAITLMEALSSGNVS